MKAVILAGGMGTRLHPLSIKRPKPMLPFFDAPLLEHIILSLKSNGFSDICICLCHMPELVRDYFGGGERLGVRIEYRLEAEPRGTAGAVKLCEDFIGGEDFLVMSGDAVSSLDLASLMLRHREAGAELSIALYACRDVSEYGAVYCGGDGRVLQINEKSAPECAYSQLASTGIYAVSTSVLKAVPEGCACDFASELFPRLISAGRPVYGFCLPGCWFDVGSPSSYRAAALYALSHDEILISARGRVRGQGSEASYVSSEAKLGEGAVIAPGCVICGASELGPGAFLRGSVVCSAQIGEAAVVCGSVLFPGSSVGAGCAIGEGCVVADGAVIGCGSVLERGSVVYPDMSFPPSSHASGRFYGEETASLRFDSSATIRCAVSEISPAAALSMGCAAGKAGSVCAAFSGGAYARVLSEAYLSGAAAAGARAILLDAKTPASAAFAAIAYGAGSCAYFSQTGGRLELRVYSGSGLSAERSFLRKLEKAASSPALSRSDSTKYGDIIQIGSCPELYVSAIKKLYAGGSCRIRLHDTGASAAFLHTALESCGLILSDAPGCAEFRLLPDGSELSAADENGLPIERDAIATLAAFSLFHLGRQEFAVPYGFPEGAAGILSDAGAQIFRLRRDGAAAERCFSALPWCFDGCFTAAAIIFLMAREGKTLAELCGETPQTARITRNYKARGSRQDIYHALEGRFDASERIFGLKLRCTLGWAHILPLPGNEYRVCSEAKSEEEAFLINTRCGEIIECA